MLRAALAAWLCFFTSALHAHAPVPRRVALTPDGSAIALSLPGFGLLFRASADQPFAFVCDALLGLRPSEVVPSLAFLADGSLLMGSANGVRILARDGCPRADHASLLSSASVIALAVRSGAPETAYAVVTGGAGGVWRSRDGGEHWELRANVDGSELTSALVVSASDPDRLYLSMRAPSGSTLLASTDGGASWTTAAEEQVLTLLSADGRAPYPLWAMARDAMAVGNRGFAILRAEAPGGPWQQMLRVNYFGGLVVDAHGVIWVGDEIGGFYRSEDGGDSFQNLESDTDVACLASAGDALWACTPGTPKEPALQRLAAGQPRSDVIAFDAVDRLVACRDLDVARGCAAAWAEWQRDVRLLPVIGPDASAPALTDAGPSSAETADAREGADEARMDDVDASPPRSLHGRDSDCSLGSTLSRAHGTRLIQALWWLITLSLAVRCRRRRRARPLRSSQLPGLGHSQAI